MDAETIAKGLSAAQRLYVLNGPYPHWTQTHRALGRKGIRPLVGVRGLNDLGVAVREILLRDQ
jgi:hypothetical protein